MSLTKKGKLVTFCNNLVASYNVVVYLLLFIMNLENVYLIDTGGCNHYPNQKQLHICYDAKITEYDSLYFFCSQLYRRKS